MRRRQLPQLPALTRGLIAGASGTAALAAWYHVTRRVRRGRYIGATILADGSAVQGLWSEVGLDYDDSIVPGQIVAKLLQLPMPTSNQAKALALALRWGYGSAFGMVHVLLRDRHREPHASVAFGAALMTVALVGLPVLGGTPVPWRWPIDAQIVSLGSHAAYIVTASMVDNLLRQA
jgi:hypothetical protein